MELLKGNNFKITYQIWGVGDDIDKKFAKNINSIKSIQRDLQVSLIWYSTNIYFMPTKYFRYWESWAGGRKHHGVGNASLWRRHVLRFKWGRGASPTSGEEGSRQRQEQAHHCQGQINRIFIFKTRCWKSQTKAQLQINISLESIYILYWQKKNIYIYTYAHVYTDIYVYQICVHT